MTEPAADALLLVSFGGPEGPDDVVPFLENVTRGRNIPRERLELVGAHYFARGGISPINGQNRELLAALEPALAAAGLDLDLYWGNRNWAPYLDDTIAEMRDAGVGRALAFVTSAYSSYSGCRQYRENLASACERAGAGAPQIDKLRVFFNHPGFIEPMADGLRTALADVGQAEPVVLFTAHSIPMSMAATSPYEAQIREAASLVAEAAGLDPAIERRVVWQSRSGPPQMPWLEPDICDEIRALEPGSFGAVIVVPVGFVSDHMEVIQDLDTDAAAAAGELGLQFRRTPTCGTDPRFISMIVELIRERVHGEAPRSLGDYGLYPEQCSATCCPAPEARGRPTRQ